MMNNCRRRGEWTELQFMAKAAKLGLRFSKPWGELSRYDIAIETAGHFARVQIKSTICRIIQQDCYICGVKPNRASKPYQLGEFDFLAAYVITEDVWYIIPAKLVVHGKKGGIRLYPSKPSSKYAPYKEAWHLLR
jgi:PD-(D/E)XK nuclease superfamily protein